MASSRSAVGWALTCAWLASQASPAQEAIQVPEPATAQPAPARKNAEEEIVVTGSRVRRKDLTTPAPVTVINKEQLQSSGIATIGDFLQQMPEQGGGVNTNVNNGGNGETQISLRNLGAQRTLVLVDGKRWVNGGGAGVGFAVDVNSIPTAAIERVEVLKDGASAVYGSDAIGGVVNIITRRRFSGVEMSAYGGISQHGDAQQTDLSLTGGATTDRGSFLFSGGYFDQKSILAANRGWANTAVAYDFSSGEISNGGSSRIPQGRVLVDLGATYHGPTAADGTPLAPDDPANYSLSCTSALCNDLRRGFFNGASTVADVLKLEKTKPGQTKVNLLPDPASSASIDGWRKFANADLYNYQAVNYLILPSTRISLFSNGDYHLSDTVRAYVQGSFVNRQSSTQLAPVPLDVSTFHVLVSKDNEYNPFGVDLFDVRRRLVEDAGRRQGFDLDTVHAVAGVDGTLAEAFGPLRGLFWDASFSYGRSSGVTTTSGSLNTQMTGAGLGPSYRDAAGWHCGTPQSGPLPNCTPVNLFGGPGTITPDMLTALGGYQGINQGWSQLTAVQLNISHELFSLAADRPVGLAAGYEYRNHQAGYIPNAIAQQFNDSDFNGAPTSGGYHVNEGYAELDIPLVNHIAGAEDLEIQGAARLFNYSTFGTDSTYKLGARWRPLRDVTLRGTWSTGFRAPDVIDLYGGRGPAAEAASDPCGAIAPTNARLLAQCRSGPGGAAAANNGDDNVQIASTIGGTPTLRPEKAKVATVGMVLEPQDLRGLSFTADYWNVQLTNQIGPNTTAAILNSCYPANIGSSAAPDPAMCARITRNPATGQIADVNDLQANVGYIYTSGVDLALRYAMPTGFGRFGLLFDSTYLIKYDYSVGSGAGAKVYHSAGNYDLGAGVPAGGLTPRVKFNAGVNWSWAGLTTGLRGRYIGGYEECADAIGGSAGTAGGGPGFCSDHAVDASGGEYPHHRVPAYLTFDLFGAYLLRSALGTTTFSAGVRNLFNTNPPVTYNSFLTYADPAYDFVGRFVYARLTQQF